MKRIQSLLVLLVGVAIGLTTGAVLTAAHGDQEPADYTQVVAQVGETKITRGQLAEFTIAQHGQKMLSGELQDMALVAEAARKAGIVIAPEDVKKRVDDNFEYTRNPMLRKQMDTIPRWLWETRMRSIMQAEKLMKLGVTNEDVTTFYIKHTADLFDSPARVTLICIATDTEAQARAAIKRLKGGEDPGQLSKLYSNDPDLREHLGRLGEFSRYDFSDARLAAAIFGDDERRGLRAKEFTLDPLPHIDEQTRKPEYLVFYVSQYTPAKRPSLEEARPLATFYARAEKYAAGAPSWFLDQIKSVEWLQVKDLADPKAPLEKVTISPSKYAPTGTDNAEDGR